MINPAAGQIKLSPAKLKKMANNIFLLINRDLQLGVLNDREFAIINLHLHLGTELIRFKVWDAAIFFIQKAYILLIMSNSRYGTLRKLEASSIRISKLTQEKEKGGNWLRGRRSK